MPFEPPNEYVQGAFDSSRDRWKRQVAAALVHDGESPDSMCICSRQVCGDREEIMDYLDTAIGIYRDAPLLRLVCGLSDAPTGNFELETIDVPIESIRKIILRKRS